MKQSKRAARKILEREIAEAVSAAHSQVFDRMGRRAIELGTCNRVGTFCRVLADAWEKENERLAQAAAQFAK